MKLRTLALLTLAIALLSAIPAAPVAARTPTKLDARMALVYELHAWAAQFDECPDLIYLNRTQYDLLLDEEEILRYVMQKHPQAFYAHGRFGRVVVQFLRSKWNGKMTQGELNRLVRVQYRLLLNGRELAAVMRWWERTR